MIRNLKVLGLALGVVFAFSAVIASGAGAAKLTSTGPVTLTGEETGAAENNQLSAFGSNVRCPGSTYTGHAVRTIKETEEGKTHELVSSGSTSVTISPKYINCKAAGLFPATVDMNGCDYDLTVGTASAHAEDTYNLTAKVTCPAGKHITVTLFKDAGEHAINTEFCHITITENEVGYTGLVVRDTTNGHLDITGTATGITAHRKLVTGHTSIFCPEQTTAVATLTQDITVKGHNNLKEATSISLSS